MGKAPPYNYGHHYYFFHAQTLIWLFFLKITFYSICRWGNELWAKPGKSQLATGEEEEAVAAAPLPPPQKPPPPPQLRVTCRTLPSGAYSPVGDGKSGERISPLVLSVAEVTGIRGEQVSPEQGICHRRLLVVWTSF